MRVEAHGVEKAVLDLRKIGLRARDMRPIKRELDRSFTRAEQHRFSSHGDGDWPALQASTLERKAQDGQSSAILRATDRLYRSLTSSFGSDHVDDVEVGTIEFGTEVPYAVFLRSGSVNMPARDPVGLRPSDLAAMARSISRYIAEGR